LPATYAEISDEKKNNMVEKARTLVTLTRNGKNQIGGANKLGEQVRGERGESGERGVADNSKLGKNGGRG